MLALELDGHPKIAKQVAKIPGIVPHQVLEGVMKDSKDTEYGTRVILEVSGKLGVQVGLDKEEAKALKPGDQLRFKASCRGVVPKENVVLCFGRILKQK